MKENRPLKWETCGICDQEKTEGYYLYQMYICIACEQKIITTDPTDEKYLYYLRKLEQINQPKLYS
ncbi:MAG TPA: sigma factor G inhibitor Gin [Cerasibacillus sp.]|uniref:sigma factor G inhibitor Gin n=1 Tax=Cerasibacillus sp. TaxID=2498711 RepID=UPI002F410D33